MAERKRKPASKKFPAFKTGAAQEAHEDNDLKKVKERVIKELEQSKANEKEWYDEELAKNLKKQ